MICCVVVLEMLSNLDGIFRLNFFTKKIMYIFNENSCVVETVSKSL